jgi:hypothetical protein
MVSEVVDVLLGSINNISNDNNNNDEDEDGVINISMMMVNPDQYPNIILRGRDAGLSVLRQHTDNGVTGDDNEEIRAIFFSERGCTTSAYNDDDDDADHKTNVDDEAAGSSSSSSSSSTPQNVLLLSTPMAAYLTVGVGTTTTENDDGNTIQNDGDRDDEKFMITHNDDEPDSSSISAPPTTTTTTISSSNNIKIYGHVYATGSQLLFVASDPGQIQYDLAIGSACIILHAMTDEPELAIYLQLTNDDDNNYSADDNGNDDTNENNSNSGPMEVTITPVDGNDCQLLFKTLCTMVSLHPTMDDNDGDYDDGDEQQGFGMRGGGYYDDENDGNDGLIWAPSAPGAGSGGWSAFGDDDDDHGGASSEVRAAMLERLDNLLVVRPGYDEEDGQFDDPDVEVVDVDVEEDDDDDLVG